MNNKNEQPESYETFDLSRHSKFLEDPEASTNLVFRHPETSSPSSPSPPPHRKEPQLCATDQERMLPMIDDIVSDPLQFILTQLNCWCLTKKPERVSENGHVFDKDDKFYVPFYKGKSMICVKVPFDCDPIMIYEEVFYGEKDFHSGMLKNRKAWIVEKNVSSEDDKEKLPKKIICFKTFGLQFQIERD